MDKLLSFQNNLLSRVNDQWHHCLYPRLQEPERLIGIKGLRGVGMTTLMLQYLRYGVDKDTRGLYVTAEHPYFYRRTLFDLGADWYRLGGNLHVGFATEVYLDQPAQIRAMWNRYKLRIITYNK